MPTTAWAGCTGIPPHPAARWTGSCRFTAWHRRLYAVTWRYRAAMHPASGNLSGREREIVGVCISLENGCGYCIEHHAAGLARHVASEEADALVAALESGADTRPLTERERAMVGYARKLTRVPGEMAEGDLQPLRAAGLSDTEILELNQVAAYFAYANRTVLGLGVEIEAEEIGLPPAERKK